MYQKFCIIIGSKYIQKFLFYLDFNQKFEFQYGTHCLIKTKSHTKNVKFGPHQKLFTIQLLFNYGLGA